MPEKGALRKPRKHALVYPFVILPCAFPSLEHMRSSAVSPDASGSVSPGERRVIHYLKIPVVSRRPTSCSCWLRIPDGFSPVSPSELPRSLGTSLYRNQLSDTADHREASAAALVLFTVTCFTVDLF